MFLLVLCISNPIDRLGDEDFATRQHAHARLKALGPLAWPALLQARHTEDPEARLRIHALLRPSLYWSANLRAAQIIAGGKYDLTAAFLDYDLRVRLFALAVANGCDGEAGIAIDEGFCIPAGEAHDLNPDHDCWDAWSVPPLVLFAVSVEACRKRLAFVGPPRQGVTASPY